MFKDVQNLLMPVLIDDIKEKRLNNLRLITGGSDTPVNGSGNWLKDMEVGTVFFAKNKVDPKDFNLVLLRLEGKDGTHDDVICLKNPRLPTENYVDPHRFTRQYDLHHVIGVMLFPQEEIKDDSNRAAPGGDTENQKVEGPVGT